MLSRGIRWVDFLCGGGRMAAFVHDSFMQPESAPPALISPVGTADRAVSSRLNKKFFALPIATRCSSAMTTVLTIARSPRGNLAWLDSADIMRISYKRVSLDRFCRFYARHGQACPPITGPDVACLAADLRARAPCRTQKKTGHALLKIPFNVLKRRFANCGRLS